MSKAIMLSIQPKWCELIANEKKTIEVRKTAPKFQTSFKCYMYCTKDAKKHYYIDEYGDRKVELIPTKIIGEFVCDNIELLRYNCDGYGDEWHEWNNEYVDYKDMCLSEKELEDYLGASNGYAWHVSDLVIYDKPRELGEFKYPCPKINAINGDCQFCKHSENSRFGKMPKCKAYLTRPPQSWCYVEKV